MKFTLILLVSLVIIVNAAGDAVSKVTAAVDKGASSVSSAAKTVAAAATSASAAIKSAASSTSASGDEISKVVSGVFNKTASEILTLKGSFNGTDTTD